MIRGHKPSGHFVTGDGAIRREGETRQCVHCGYTWEYVPRSGARRGWCLKCDGFLCGHAECEADQRRLLTSLGLDAGCIPYSDVNARLLEAYGKDSRYTVLPSGIVVRAGDR